MTDLTNNASSDSPAAQAPLTMNAGDDLPVPSCDETVDQVVVTEHAGAHLTNTAHSAVKELAGAGNPFSDGTDTPGADPTNNSSSATGVELA